MKKVILLSLLVSFGACSSTFFTPYDKSGRISLSADEKGMRAFSDMMVGLVNEGKTPKGKKSSHYQMRTEQERTEQMSWQAKIQTRYNQGGTSNE